MTRLTRDELIAALYTAAVHEDALVRMADALRAYVDVDSAGLWLIERGEIRELSQTADIVESTVPYLSYYRNLDPWSAYPKAPGRAYLGSDNVREDAFVRTEFYQDFARHYGMLRPMGVVLDLEPGVSGTIALNRVGTRHLLDEPDRAVLQDLVPHLQAALTLRGRIQAERRQSVARGGALDAVAFGIVVCDGEGRVHTVNSAAAGFAAERLLALDARNGGVATRTLQDTATLQALIRSAAAGRPGAMRIDGPEGAGLSVLVTPTVNEGQSRALLCLWRTDAPAGLDTATLSRLFRLSPSQAELCLLLLAGRTFDEAAAERGIATSTARSHFAAILARTGASNLRDLLRLLGTIPQVKPMP